MAEEAAVQALVAGIAAQEGRLDALVCNAGFMIRKPLRDLTLAEWNAVLGTNLTSSFLLVRAAEAMLRAARGAVVTIASTRAHQSEPDTESYSASKGGLLALTHALAVSLGPDVRVNCVSPGWIETKGRGAVGRGPGAAPGRPRRPAAGRGGAGRLAVRPGERLRHRRGIRHRWRDDAEDDLRGLGRVCKGRSFGLEFPYGIGETI